jgi:molybdate/tungstate transport system substrate-binding protein
VAQLSTNERMKYRVATPWPLAATSVVIAMIATGSLAGTLTNPTVAAAATVNASGTVNVLYAGSLLNVMAQKIGPAFHKATGFTLSGFSAGSKALASQIKGGIQVGDVFISASPTVNTTLEGAANGNWVSSFAEFGGSPLVLAYYPGSNFAHDLKTKAWYDVVDLPGFLLGRTDPATDPKGALAVNALTGVALSYAKPSLAPLASSTSNVFEETALVGQLQAGQLDAGFFYAVEAAAAHLKTVKLTGTRLFAHYTVAILNRAPHQAAAKAFVRFLLGVSGQRILNANGVTSLIPNHVLTYGSGTTNVTTSPPPFTTQP